MWVLLLFRVVGFFLISLDSVWILQGWKGLWVFSFWVFGGEFWGLGILSGSSNGRRVERIFSLLCFVVNFSVFWILCGCSRAGRVCGLYVWGFVYAFWYTRNRKCM